MRIRYSRWDGTQTVGDVDADDVLDAIEEGVLVHDAEQLLVVSHPRERVSPRVYDDGTVAGRRNGRPTRLDEDGFEVVRVTHRRSGRGPTGGRPVHGCLGGPGALAEVDKGGVAAEAPTVLREAA